MDLEHLRPSHRLLLQQLHRVTTHIALATHTVYFFLLSAIVISVWIDVIKRSSTNESRRCPSYDVSRGQIRRFWFIVIVIISTTARFHECRLEWRHQLGQWRRRRRRNFYVHDDVNGIQRRRNELGCRFVTTTAVFRRPVNDVRRRRRWRRRRR